MYNKILEHLTTGCRALIAAVLLIAGIIWQAAAGKLLPPRRIRHHRRNSIVYPLDCVSPRRLGVKYLSFKIGKCWEKNRARCPRYDRQCTADRGRLPCTDFGVLEENSEKNVMGLSH